MSASRGTVLSLAPGLPSANTGCHKRHKIVHGIFETLEHPKIYTGWRHPKIYTGCLKHCAHSGTKDIQRTLTADVCSHLPPNVPCFLSSPIKKNSLLFVPYRWPFCLFLGTINCTSFCLCTSLVMSEDLCLTQFLVRSKIKVFWNWIYVWTTWFKIIGGKWCV